MEVSPNQSAETDVANLESQETFVPLTAAELGFNGDEMVEYGPYVASVNQTLQECQPISHLGPDIARMVMAQGIELYKTNHPEIKEETEVESELQDEPDEDTKKKLN